MMTGLGVCAATDRTPRAQKRVNRHGVRIALDRQVAKFNLGSGKRFLASVKQDRSYRNGHGRASVDRNVRDGVLSGVYPGLGLALMGLRRKRMVFSSKPGPAW